MCGPCRSEPARLVLSELASKRAARDDQTLHARISCLETLGAPAAMSTGVAAPERALSSHLRRRHFGGSVWMTDRSETDIAVMDTRGLQWASSKARVEAVLGRRPGVLSVDANPVAQTATIRFDPDSTTVGELVGWIRECDLHCRGQSVPEHVFDPMEEPHDVAGSQDGQAATAPADRHAVHDDALSVDDPSSPHEVMGHGGGHVGSDMRRRFFVAAIFSVPIVLWTPIGRDVMGFDVAAPFGLRDDVWSLLLSLP